MAHKGPFVAGPDGEVCAACKSPLGQNVECISEGPVTLILTPSPQALLVENLLRELLAMGNFNALVQDRIKWAINHVASLSALQGGWRDVCADMIRIGRDKEAWELLLKESKPVFNELTQYTSALEAVFVHILHMYRSQMFHGIFDMYPHHREKILDLQASIEHVMEVRDPGGVKEWYRKGESEEVK